MSALSDTTIWGVIAVLGLATFLMRFVFLGLVGDRPMPPWLLRHLRYTGVAVLPGLVAPLVAWPAATDGAMDPARLAAAAVALGVGAWRRDAILAVAAGAATLALGLWLG